MKCSVCGNSKFTQEQSGPAFDEKGWYHVVKDTCANGHTKESIVRQKTVEPGKRVFD